MFVKLTSVENGREGAVYIAPQHIVYVREYAEGGIYLSTTSGSSIRIRENAEEVYRLIDKSVEQTVVEAVGRSKDLARLMNFDESLADA